MKARRQSAPLFLLLIYTVLTVHCNIKSRWPGNADCPWRLLCRSCCPSVRATETASCLSPTCCSGRTPALALANTSMWTTSVNQVSSAARFPFVPTRSQAFYCELLHCPPPPQLNTKDMWCARGGRWSCAVSPPRFWTSMQLSMGEVWARLTPAPHTWQDHPHLVSQRDCQCCHMVATNTMKPGIL